jgi:5-methyltetrahydrofolate--homocysteine methyltransferase
VVALSALLTTTMMNMGEVIRALETAGVRDRVRVMIGGAPISQSFANQIGADGYSADAASASALARDLVLSLGR